MTSDSENAGKNVIITIELSAEDLPRLEKAFAEGRLAELGITDIRVHPEQDAQQAKGKWSAQEAKSQPPKGEERSI